MELQDHLQNSRGQILIETLFLVILIVVILAVFKQLIDFKKTKQHFRFSKENIKKEY